MSRGPYAFRTKDMTAEERASWFATEGNRAYLTRKNPGRTRRMELSFIFRKALRQDWRLKE